MKGTIWCLHGAVGMADDWRGFSVPGWSVKRVDLWRFLDCCPMSMPEFGDALNEEASATADRKVVLGYSMGGRLALHALLAGGPWEAGIIVSAHPGLEAEAEKVARRASDAEWAAAALRGDWKDFLAAWNGQAVLKAPDGGRNACGFEDRSRLEQRRQAVARSFMDWTLGGQEALTSRLGALSCPLLWTVGGKDSKFRKLGEQVARANPGGLEFWPAEGAGHRVPWDVPELFEKKVGEFLEGLDS